MDVESYVQIYGEKYRNLIEHALHWLDEKEPLWQLPEPMNRGEYIQGLVERANVVDDPV